jgi:hypothetical protein
MANTIPIKYKNIVIDNQTLKLSVPKKINGVYTSNISYGENPFFVQTPELKQLDSNTLTFEMINNGDFFNLFENLSNHIVEFLYVNSKEFFNGKEFNEARINESLVKITSVNESGQVKLHVADSVEVCIVNILNEKVKQPISPFSGKFILHVKNITFSKKEFKINIYIKNIKLCKKKVYSQINFDLDLSESDSEENSIEKQEELLEQELKKKLEQKQLEEQEELKKKLEQKQVEEQEELKKKLEAEKQQELIVEEEIKENKIEPQELIVEKENVDDLDFFEL